MIRRLITPFSWVHGVLLSAVILALSAVVYWSWSPSRPPAASPLPVYNAVGNFSLIDQANQPVTRESLRDMIWVADFIFTRCAGPCPKMSQQMARLQSVLLPENKIRFVTITADPVHDTPEVLAQYAARYSARPDRWSFLTGDKAQIHALATNSFKLVVADGASAEELFIHSTKFVLVDDRGQVRGYFEGTDPGVERELVAAVKALQNEPAP